MTKGRYGNQKPVRCESIHVWGVERRMWKRLVADCQTKRVRVCDRVNELLRGAGYGEASKH